MGGAYFDIFEMFCTWFHYVPDGRIKPILSLVFLIITGIYVVGGLFHGYQALKKG